MIFLMQSLYHNSFYLHNILKCLFQNELCKCVKKYISNLAQHICANVDICYNNVVHIPLIFAHFIKILSRNPFVSINITSYYIRTYSTKMATY